jgi:hypothetical protein
VRTGTGRAGPLNARIATFNRAVGTYSRELYWAYCVLLVKKNAIPETGLGVCGISNRALNPLTFASPRHLQTLMRHLYKRVDLTSG